MKKNGIKDLLQLNVTIGQASSLIPILETEVGEIGTKYTEAKGEADLAEQDYMQKKKIETELKEIWNEKKALLETILRHTGKLKNKDARLMRSSSHTESKPSNRIQWGQEFMLILKTEQRFMSYQELVSHYGKRHPGIDLTTDAMKKKIAHQEGNFVASEPAIKKFIKEGVRKSQRQIPLFRYNDKWGLAEWFTDDLVPHPKYIKEFMFADQNRLAKVV
jgi:hypothetical protein